MGTASRPASLHLLGQPAPVAAYDAARWEWRVFASGVLPLHHRDLPARGEPGSVVQEVYLVSSRTEHSVTVRGRELHIEMLERTAPGGLELWTAAMRTRFPIASRVMQALCDVWGLPTTGASRLSYGIGDFERAIQSCRHVLHPVVVTKRRTRLELLRCAGEREELIVNGERWETIAFHDPDPTLVRAVVNHLGLGHYANVNYPSALRRMTGWAPDASRRA